MFGSSSLEKKRAAGLEVGQAPLEVLNQGRRQYLSHLIFFFQPGLGPGFFLAFGSSTFASLLSTFLLLDPLRGKEKAGKVAGILWIRKWGEGKCSWHLHPQEVERPGAKAHLFSGYGSKDSSDDCALLWFSSSFEDSLRKETNF